MRKIIYILLLMICYSAFSENIQIYNLNTSRFPIISAKIRAYDYSGAQVLDLDKSRIKVFENGIERSVNTLSCPEPQAPRPLSSVLVMDVSLSMGSGKNNEIFIDVAKNAARVWISKLGQGVAECALVSFDNKNYLNQDFTTDHSKLSEAINSLAPKNGTDYDAALLAPNAGGLLISKKGSNKRTIVMLTDGCPNDMPETTKIIEEAKKQNCAIFAVCVNMPCPDVLKQITLETGGLWFENIVTSQEAEQVYNKIYYVAQTTTSPCDIEWTSGMFCSPGNTDVEISETTRVLSGHANYQHPLSSVAYLEFSPEVIKFKNPIVGVPNQKSIILKANNYDFTVTNIKSSNSSYSVSPTNFLLKNGQSQALTVTYIPPDSGYSYCKFTFETQLCDTVYSVSGGYKGKKPINKTIELIKPNGGETFIGGTVENITWGGILPTEKVIIEYSINNGATWNLITDTASGFSYKWLVPKTQSNNCLARVSSKYEVDENPDVKIGNQIWSGNNLDVTTYRNGDPIPQVTDPVKWANLTTGAWCYYNNDSVNCAKYGKIYNWYAINDKRGLAPYGWRIATDNDWRTLANYIGGTSVAGGKLKDEGTIQDKSGLWNAPNVGATNEIGFAALPGGMRKNNGVFVDLSNWGYWWTSTMSEVDNSYSYYVSMSLSDTNLNVGNYHYKTVGMTVRLVK